MLKRALATATAPADQPQPQAQPQPPPQLPPQTRVIPPSPGANGPAPLSPPSGYENYWQGGQMNASQVVGYNGVLPPLLPDLGQSGLPTISWLCSCNLCIESVKQFITALNNSNGVYAACISSAGPVYNELLSSSNIQMQPPPHILTDVNGNLPGNTENISVASIGIGIESVKIENNREDDVPADETTSGEEVVAAAVDDAQSPVSAEKVSGTLQINSQGDISDENRTDGGSSGAVPASSTSFEDNSDTASVSSFFWGNNGSSELVSPDCGSGGEENFFKAQGLNTEEQSGAENLNQKETNESTEPDEKPEPEVEASSSKDDNSPEAEEDPKEKSSEEV